jgi:hypothetical protein
MAVGGWKMDFLFRIGLAVAYILMAYFTAWLVSVVDDDELDRQNFSICLCIWWLVLPVVVAVCIVEFFRVKQ